MGGDHLDKDISVSAEITPSGVKASAKSRALAAIDRLIGSGIDRLSAPLESKTAEIRAKSEARVKLIGVLGDLGIERLKAEPEVIAAAIENHIGSLIRRQENKVAVVKASLDDLRQEPPAGEAEAEEREKLGSQFLDRFERYAEEATEDQMREKWGRILAAEIRRPGTFSPKSMRIVDELDANTAILFERICECRVHNVLLKCLTGELSFDEVSSLVSAGLLVDPGLTGQNLQFSEATDGGLKIWIAIMGDAAIAIPRAAILSNIPQTPLAPITMQGDKPSTPVYVLTDTGRAISHILKDNTAEALSSYSKLAASIPTLVEVREYRKSKEGSFNLINIHHQPTS